MQNITVCDFNQEILEKKIDTPVMMSHFALTTQRCIKAYDPK